MTDRDNSKSRVSPASEVNSSPPLATVTLVYRGRYCAQTELQIECDVYQRDDGLAVHTICPRCLGAQWIDGRRKAIEFDPELASLHIEPFECTWELGPERREFGLSLCRCRIAYSGHEIRDA